MKRSGDNLYGDGLLYTGAAEPQRLRFNVGAIGQIETDYYLKLFFHGDLLVNNQPVTNQFDALKDKISVNGKTLAEILTPRQFGNVHWVKEGAADIPPTIWN